MNITHRRITPTLNIKILFLNNTLLHILHLIAPRNLGSKSQNLSFKQTKMFKMIINFTMFVLSL